MPKRILLSLFTIIILCALGPTPVHASLDIARGVKIELSLAHQILRGEIIVISGRLSTIANDYPIALATIHLQYYRLGDGYFTREVTIISSNPSGLFEDRFNTTSLLRIGTWFVNASFPSQYGYPSASTVESFTVVVQPALSLYVSSHKIALGQSISLNGLLFACIPCIHDEVTVILSRPDNTSVSVSLKLSPVGGPYPGGYYNGSFSPDTPGLWHVKAVWKGNEVTLPAYSQIEELDVVVPSAVPDQLIIYSVVAVVLSTCAFTVAALLWRRREHASSECATRSESLR
jgi:hypothetical protein